MCNHSAEMSAMANVGVCWYVVGWRENGGGWRQWRSRGENRPAAAFAKKCWLSRRRNQAAMKFRYLLIFSVVAYKSA
jgi:hypothetical protein